jgi:RNA polymerase sigma-70 factor (ECF subfamily)
MEHKKSLPEVRDLRVWLVRITWNLALDRRRRVRPDQLDDTFALSLIGRNTPADIALHESRELAGVFREIDRLPRAERQVLLLSAIEELDTRELAQVLNKSESAIRALIFRARARLRQRLQKNDARLEKNQARLQKGGHA